MKKLFKAIVVLAFVGLIAAAVASYVSKKKLESMSDEEIREFLAQKLTGKVGDEQLGTIQDSVIAGVRKTRGAVDSAEEAADDAIEAVQDAASEASDSAAETKAAVTKIVKDVGDESEDDAG